MYATQAQFIEAFGEPETLMLTNLDSPNTTTVNPVPLDRALTDASALIDSYLARRYLLPLASVPQVLIPYCLDIARYKLDRIRSREDVRQRYEDAIKWLEMVASGKVYLAVDTSNVPVPQAESVGMVAYGSSHPIDLEGF